MGPSWTPSAFKALKSADGKADLRRLKNNRSPRTGGASWTHAYWCAQAASRAVVPLVKGNGFQHSLVFFPCNSFPHHPNACVVPSCLCRSRRPSGESEGLEDAVSSSHRRPAWHTSPWEEMLMRAREGLTRAPCGAQQEPPSSPTRGYAGKLL